MIWLTLILWFSSPIAIDGDTIWSDGTLIRLVGFNSPELNGDCQAERDLALAAKRELIRLLPALRFEPRECVGWNYGRACAEGFMPDGSSLAAHMIGAGLAEAYVFLGAGIGAVI
jgi:micrococcal nuclease